MPYEIWEGTACFTTHVVRAHTPVFTAPQYMETVCQALNHAREKSDLKIYGYVIMPDHLHLLTSVGQPAKLNATLVAFRRFTAFKIFEMLEMDRKTWALKPLQQASGNGQLWADGFTPRDASRGDIFDQKLDYIHMNPVRTGFVRSPEDWQYLSARHYYLHEKGPVAIDHIWEGPMDWQIENQAANEHKDTGCNKVQPEPPPT
ncbi:MAG: transposase [Candidatus Sumerlaeaceae bacterium]|nr:transposase [Candidatus Sumerlaeaceae bacterium]